MLSFHCHSLSISARLQKTAQALLLLCLTTIPWVACATENPVQDADYYLSLGQQKLDDKDIDGAIQALDTAVATYEKSAGSKSKEMIKPLLALAEALLVSQEKEHRARVMGTFSQAVDISKKNYGKNTEQHSDTLLKTGQIICKRGGFMEAESYLKNAHRIYAKQQGKHYWKVAKVNHLLGKLYMAHRANLKGIKRFKAVLNYFEKAGSSPKLQTSYQLAAHKFLVRLYMRTAEYHRADKHSQAFAQLSPWLEDDKPRILHKRTPVAPEGFTEEDNPIALRFFIDKKGRVKNPEVVADTDDEAKKIALNSVKKWRFVPRFENGEFTEVSVKMDFKFHVNKPVKEKS